MLAVSTISSSAVMSTVQALSVLVDLMRFLFDSLSKDQILSFISITYLEFSSSYGVLVLCWMEGCPLLFPSLI